MFLQPHGLIRPSGYQRLRSFTGINPHSSVRTSPPDFAVVSGLFVIRNRSTTALLPYNRQQGGGAITSTLPLRRVHGDFHRLNLGHPHASHHAGMAPFPSRLRHPLYGSAGHVLVQCVLQARISRLVILFRMVSRHHRPHPKNLHIHHQRMDH